MTRRGAALPALTVVVFVAALGLPVFGAAAPAPIWTPSDHSGPWRPISLAGDGWVPLDDAAAACDAARYFPGTGGPEPVTLIASGRACAEARSLALTWQAGRVNLFGTISSATETMSLSTNLNLALQYRLTDTLKVGVQEMLGAEATLLATLVAVPTLAPAGATALGPVAWTADAAVTRLLLEHTSGPWSAHVALVTGSLFTLEELEIQHAITSAWTADVAIDRTLAGFATLDAARLAVYGRAGEMSVALAYTRTAAAVVQDGDGLLAPQTFTQSVDVPSLSVSWPKWDWRWTLTGTGGAVSDFSLTAQRFEPDLAVTISGVPFRLSVAYNTEF